MTAATMRRRREPAKTRTVKIMEKRRRAVTRELSQ